MSKADEEAERMERARRVGLFRYMLIREAADPGLSGRQRGALVRALAAAEHVGPDGRPVRLTRWTLDRWIAEWRAGGFDALVPSPRQCAPRTSAEVLEVADRSAGAADPQGAVGVGAGRAHTAAALCPPGPGPGCRARNPGGIRAVRGVAAE
jgi:putative transposase